MYGWLDSCKFKLLALHILIPSGLEGTASALFPPSLTNFVATAAERPKAT